MMLLILPDNFTQFAGFIVLCVSTVAICWKAIIEWKDSEVKKIDRDLAIAKSKEFSVESAVRLMDMVAIVERKIEDVRKDGNNDKEYFKDQMSKIQASVHDLHENVFKLLMGEKFDKK